jgi:hypothetical protein
MKNIYRFFSEMKCHLKFYIRANEPLYQLMYLITKQFC